MTGVPPGKADPAFMGQLPLPAKVGSARRAKVTQIGKKFSVNLIRCQISPVFSVSRDGKQDALTEGRRSGAASGQSGKDFGQRSFLIVLLHFSAKPAAPSPSDPNQRAVEGWRRLSR